MSDLSNYPPDWPEISKQVKDAAGWRCVRCKHPHESPKERIRCDDICDLMRHPDVMQAEFLVNYTNDDPRLDTRHVVYDKQRQRVLTVHHLDGNKANVRWWNLVALCQVCHLIIQAKVKMFRPWLMFEHSEWFKPYVAGFYAYRYLGEDLIRTAVEERLDELLALEGPLTFPTWEEKT